MTWPLSLTLLFAFNNSIKKTSFWLLLCCVLPVSPPSLSLHYLLTNFFGGSSVRNSSFSVFEIFSCICVWELKWDWIAVVWCLILPRFSVSIGSLTHLPPLCIASLHSVLFPSQMSPDSASLTFQHSHRWGPRISTEQVLESQEVEMWGQLLVTSN